MDAARPLRDVFADLAQDEDAPSPQDVLRANGHPDLPDGLVAEAVGSYADTAPIEVAEHLSPYVMAHSSVPLPGVADVDAAGWLNAMVTAPVVDEVLPGDPADDLDDAPDAVARDADASQAHDAGHHAGPDHDASWDGDAGLDGEPDAGLQFGHGTGAGREAASDAGDGPIHQLDLDDIDEGRGGPAPAESALDPGYDPSGFDQLDEPDVPHDGGDSPDDTAI